MADKKLTALPEMTNPLAAADWLALVDSDDLTDDPAGSSRKLGAAKVVWGDGTPVTISGGGTINLGGYNLTAPASGTLALLGTTNVFLAEQTVKGADLVIQTAAGAEVMRFNMEGAHDIAPDIDIDATGSIVAEDDMYFAIDSDGSGTTAKFVWARDAKVTGSMTEIMRLNEAGRLGIGVSSPQGVIHSHDGVGGFMVWSGNINSGVAFTLIPNGSGDVIYRLSYQSTIRLDTGAKETGNGGVNNGSNINIYDIGGNTLTLAVAADGSVTIQRTAGTAVYTVTLVLSWI